MAFSFLKDYNDPEVNQCITYTEAVKNRVKNHPEHVVYRFMEDGVNESGHLTYSDLEKNAKSLGVEMQKVGTKGDSVLLLFQPGLEYISALFACFYTGFIAIPAYPPRRNRGLERIFSIIEDSQTDICLISRSVYNDIQRNFSDEELLRNINWIVFEDIPKQGYTEFKDVEILPDNIALIQYTSGSTGSPKGVMISQENLLYNSEYIRQSFNVTKESVGVHWLPIFHDMGLVGGILQAAYVCGKNINMPPMAFLKDPLNWLKAIDKYGGTIAGGPNFAFDYCVQKTTEEDRKQLDLSTIEVMFCGAEPIRENTYKTFIDSFSVSGFKSHQLYSCYGMAETTLIVTGGNSEDEPVYLSVDADKLANNKVEIIENGQIVVGCGHTWMDTVVEIVDPSEHMALEEMQIGEVWVKGPTVAKGYWKNEELSNEVFGGMLDQKENGPFLKTGDLGFLYQGELFIAGRLKDLIIIRGVNYYPNDIEFAIQESGSHIRKNGGAAFSVTINNDEKIVIVQELERTSMRLESFDDVYNSIREKVVSSFEVDPYSIILVKTGSIPLTSSGKIRRRQTKLDFINDELNVVARWVNDSDVYSMSSEQSIHTPSEEAIKIWLTEWIMRNQNIRRQDIDPEKNILSFGIDSLAAVTLETEISNHFSFQWHISSFMLNPTINKLAKEGMELYEEARKEGLI